MDILVFGKIEEVIDPAGNSTKFAYDKMQNITSVITAEGSETQYQYDDHNRLNRITDPEGNSTTLLS